MSPQRRRLLLVVAASAVLLAGLVVQLRAPAADLLVERGLQARRAWQLERAERYFDWALLLDAGHVEARLEKALCVQLSGDFLASSPELEYLTSIPTGDQTFRARTWNAVGVGHFNSSRPEAAAEAHERALEIARTVGDRRLEAQALIGSSRVLYHLNGRADEALVVLERALAIAREIGDASAEADALRNIGAVSWWFRGERERALAACYAPALEIYRRIDDRHGVATTLSNIGLIHAERGELFDYLRCEKESLDIRRRIGDRAGMCDAFMSLAAMYQSAGNSRRAHEYYSRGLALSEQIGYRLTQYELENRLAKFYRDLGEIEKAMEMLRRLLERSENSPVQAKYCLVWLAYCHQRNGELEMARRYAERALELHRETSDANFLAGTLTLLAEAYLDAGDLTKSAELLSQAEALVASEGGPMGAQAAINWGLARLEQKRGQRQRAIELLLESADIETRLLGAAETLFLRGQNRELYDRLFTLLLERPEPDEAPDGGDSTRRSNDEAAFRVLERLRYRSLRTLVLQLGDREHGRRPSEPAQQEALARIERISAALKAGYSPALMEQLRRAYGDYEDRVLEAELVRPRYEAIRTARPVDVRVIQQRLDPQTALVAYVFAGDACYALVVSRAEIRSLVLPVTRSNLLAKVRLFRSLVFDGEQTFVWQPVSDDLRRVLVDPLEQSGAFAGVHRLGILPYGALHDLPFAALSRLESGRVRFLIEEYSLFFPPSAAFLINAVGSSGNGPMSERHLLAFGRNDSDEAGLPPLRFAAEEATAVAAAFGGRALVGVEASEVEFKRLAPGVDVLHLATHAIAEPEMPLLSRLKFAAAAGEDGNLTVPEVFDLRLRAELVTLGACRTAQSYSSSGTEVGELDRIGLKEAFLRAGARSVLASLLPIRDRETTDLMGAFYRNLRSMDKAEALAEAQREMLRSNGAHPRDWAAFVLAGDHR